MLFSATQTKKVEDLARLSIQKSAVYVEVENETSLATASGLEQGYVTCPSDKRFLLLYTFLRKNKNKKVMVFFSSCNSVKFHADLLNYIDLPVMEIHGKLKQQKRTTTFFQFCKSEKGVLCCTDVGEASISRVFLLSILGTNWRYLPLDKAVFLRVSIMHTSSLAGISPTPHLRLPHPLIPPKFIVRQRRAALISPLSTGSYSSIRLMTRGSTSTG